MKKVKEVERCLIIGDDVLVVEENSKEELKNWISDYQSLETNNS